MTYGARGLQRPRSLQPEEWHVEYFDAIQKLLTELELAFGENAIVLGPAIMAVWHRYSGHLVMLRTEADYDGFAREQLEELMDWCSGFPTALADAIERTISNPTVSLLPIEEVRRIRKEAMDATEQRMDAARAKRQQGREDRSP